jgi:hypothetical protein
MRRQVDVETTSVFNRSTSRLHFDVETTSCGWVKRFLLQSTVTQVLGFTSVNYKDVQYNVREGIGVNIKGIYIRARNMRVLPRQWFQKWGNGSSSH